MIRYQVQLSPRHTADDVEAWMENLGRREGFAVGPRTSLRTIPHSAHWHLTRGRGAGTVEVTLHPSGAVVIAVHDNRRGTWALEAAAVLVENVRSSLGCDPPKAG